MSDAAVITLLQQIRDSIDQLGDVSPISAALVAQLLNDAGGFNAITEGTRITMEGGAILDDYVAGGFGYLRIDPPPSDTIVIDFFRIIDVPSTDLRVRFHSANGSHSPRIEILPKSANSTITLDGSPVLAERDLPLPGMWKYQGTATIGPGATASLPGNLLNGTTQHTQLICITTTESFVNDVLVFRDNTTYNYLATGTATIANGITGYFDITNGSGGFTYDFSLYTLDFNFT